MHDRRPHSSSLATSVLLALTTGLLSGCYAGPFYAETWFIDKQSDQPWFGPSDRADPSIYAKRDFVRSHLEARWSADDGREVDIGEVVAHCERYLREVGAADEPLTPDGEPAGLRPSAVFAHTKTIVCLDPIVVIRTPVERIAPQSDISLEATEVDMLLPISATRLHLPHGYDYGTRVAHADGLDWFSPDLARGPEPIPRLEDGRGVIDVPWGRLLLASSSAGWAIEPQPLNTAAARKRPAPAHAGYD